MAGKDLFIPFSDINWLNSVFSWLYTFETPIATHKNVGFFVAFIGIIVAFYILIFVKEEVKKKEN